MKKTFVLDTNVLLVGQSDKCVSIAAVVGVPIKRCTDWEHDCVEIEGIESFDLKTRGLRAMAGDTNELC